MNPQQESLGALDRKIIYELDLNPRGSLTVAARKLRMNRNTLEYRLNNLLKRGILKNFYPIINGFNLGFFYYKYFIKVQSSNIHLSLETLFQNENIVWIGKTDGPWDFSITLRAKDQDELRKTLNLINEQVKLRDKSLETIRTASLFNERWIDDSKKSKEILNKFDNQSVIDNTDIQILKTLSKNARESLVHIAKKTHLTPEAITKRLARLEKLKIVLGYKARINYALLGYDYHHMLISVTTPDAIEKIVSYLRYHASCVTTIELLGKYDIQAEFIAKSHGGIRTIIDELKNNFPNQIQEIENVFIVEETTIKTF